MTKVIERRENEVTDFIIDGHAEKVNPDEGNILCAAGTDLTRVFVADGCQCADGKPGRTYSSQVLSR